MSISESKQTASKLRPRLVDYLLTPLFLLSFILNLLLFELLFRLIRLFPENKFYERLFIGINRGVIFCLKTCAMMSYSQQGQFPAGSKLPVIVVSNHQSMFDIPFLVLALKGMKLRFVAKAELARKIPGISIALRNGEHAIIDRKNPKQALPELKQKAALSLNQGFSLVLFPEGTRSKDGKLKSFKVGGVSQILESYGRALILPVAIKGSWRLASFGLLPIVSFRRVGVQITQAFEVESGHDVVAYMEKARSQIQEALGSDN